jgi:hypothetical protein
VTHRAEQIVDAAAAILAAHALLTGVKVVQHRVLSLSLDDQELPAVSITIGDDSALEEDGATNFAFLDSLLSLAFRIVVKVDDGDEEEDAIGQLLDVRRAVHVALMADQTLGLTFVIDTRYGGADAPILDGISENMCGMMDCRWSVHYRMNYADPQ